MTLPLVIDRPCARQYCGLLAVIYLSGALALPAHAHSFDLECVVLDASGNVNYSQQGKHLQVDLESGQWCEERCSEIGEGAHLQESGQLVLKDGEDYFGQSALLYYVPDEKLLVDVFDLGGRFERVSNYTCSEDAFGGLEPYLAEPAYPRSMNRLWSLFQPANLPDGFTRPSEDGSVGISLAVSRGGLLEACSIHSSSGSQELDDFTCAVIEQAELTFTPAKDRGGMDTEGTYRTTVVFSGW